MLGLIKSTIGNTADPNPRFMPLIFQIDYNLDRRRPGVGRRLGQWLPVSTLLCC